MKTLLRLLLKSQHQQNRSGPAQTEKGMTLVELLVGAIMAFLIITPMLGFVVDMLNTDRREQVKSNTEQDLQAAVDFIAQDLSQAIYIYDQAGITAPTVKLPPPPTNTTGTPILVFWKRQQIKNAVPINSTVSAKTPSACPPNGSECNDTYVLSLVVYYQVRDIAPNPTWCQPLGGGGTCPTRIARYEIRDGVKNPNSSNPTNPYYSLTDADEYAPDAAFEPSFDISKPLVNVTKGAGFKDAQVLVNYIDHSQLTGIPINPAECQTALGNPKDTTGVTPTDIPETTLRIPPAPPDIVKSFYACVDTSKNIARVTLRGNSLRRIQTDANYDASRSAYFPTASVQVQGLGALGK
ncbi:hormogonium polysaccharide secretion pseudopilin HpsC [Microcoleus sp. Pol12B4]|uniref:hormogonium polysaccharide secretion pseudopilin HpsC n=1 Tax=Microcoleus sp. Pol12B4 TaxID=3055395 RepID=UPI002FD65889